MYLTGPDAQKVADWIFTADLDKDPKRVVYTCALNKRGGVEADAAVISLNQGVGTLVGPILKVGVQIPQLSMALETQLRGHPNLRDL